MEENNKRIVRNTVYLYVRMLVMTALGFVTTRIVLEKLGASDYVSIVYWEVLLTCLPY